MTQDISAAPTPNAFKLGHVFKQADLPPHQQHLIGGLYFADNKDGSMRIVSKELHAQPTIWRNFEHEVEKINRDWAKGDNPNVRVGTQEDWATLLKSEFTEQAGLAEKTPFGTTAFYWQESPGNRKNARLVCDPQHPDRKIAIGIKQGRAYGRFFVDMPCFEP